MDKVYGNRGPDELNVADGDRVDTVNGRPGRDSCEVDLPGDTYKNCESVNGEILIPE